MKKTPDQITHDVDLGRWLGRRDAFAAVAGRCSAAQIESLRRIRDEKLYAGHARNWDEFCSRQLGVSRRNVERQIALLTEFGPEYFHVAQMAHIGPKEYRAIAGHVDKEGVRLDGTVVALLPENSDRIATAVSELLRRAEPEPGCESQKSLPAAPTFDAVIQRFVAALEALDAYEPILEVEQRLALADVITTLRKGAVRHGVQVFDCR